jgi:histidine triad (HIT) family protein
MCDCIFCKMVKGEIPTNKLYEDDDFIVIKDINPKPKIHYLLIPKEHYKDLTELTEERAVRLGKGLKKLASLADNELNMKEGFRVVSNKGKFGTQSVEHLHFHLIGGEQLSENMG